LPAAPSTTTKNTGTKNTASTVALIMPPNTPVPIACCVSALAPVASISGTTPRAKASDVIRIGRRRRRAASTAASTSPRPCACSWRAYSTIRMAFFAERPMMVIMPTLKNTSFGMPRSITASTAPSRPSGTTSITETGMLQLSYRAASTRKTTSIDSAISMGACDADSFSCSDWPVHASAKPGGNCFTRRSISSMASPLDTPGAALPEMRAAG